MKITNKNVDKILRKIGNKYAGDRVILETYIDFLAEIVFKIKDGSRSSEVAYYDYENYSLLTATLSQKRKALIKTIKQLSSYKEPIILEL